MSEIGDRDISRARRLRAGQTPPEGVLWSRLRGRRLGGLKFRRQHPIEGLVVDLCCPTARLVVEVDSAYHACRRAEDAARDERMAALGYLTLRVTASQIATNLDGVLEVIRGVGLERLRG